MKKILDKKINLGVIFGGMSTENEVSCISGVAVINNLNKEKYNINPIYIDKSGNWFILKDLQQNAKLGNELDNREQIENVVEFLKGLDIVFPVLHGMYGEDGTIQGLFEILKIPYVGCGVLSSSVAMDKIYTKIIFNEIGINQAKYIDIRKYNDKYMYVDKNFNFHELELEKIIDIVIEKIKLPVFVKPSNSGSSVGVSKAHNREELEKAINEASKFDKKILVEEAIVGKELECAVLGNEEIEVSCVGEIKSAEDFYSYDAKYNNQDSRTIIPAKIPEEKSLEIKELAKKAFKAIDGKGLSRVDFFMQDKTQKIYINEINTLPGFTNISMYPKLFMHEGIKYSDLLDKLIQLAQ